MRMQHFHFTSWHHQSLPECTDSLLCLRELVKGGTAESSGPILVHCRLSTLSNYFQLLCMLSHLHSICIYQFQYLLFVHFHNMFIYMTIMIVALELAKQVYL